MDHNFLDPRLLEIELENLKTFIPAERVSFRMIFGAVRHLVMLLF